MQPLSAMVAAVVSTSAASVQATFHRLQRSLYSKCSFFNT